jgi:hypothetical protein
MDAMDERRARYAGLPDADGGRRAGGVTSVPHPAAPCDPAWAGRGGSMRWDAVP